MEDVRIDTGVYLKKIQIKLEVISPKQENNLSLSCSS